MLRKQLNIPDSTATIKKFHWWWRMHMNKWIDCDRFCDDQVNKCPITMAGFTEAEEQAQHCTNKWSGTIQKWQDLGLSNASLKGGFRRECKLWWSAMGKAPKPSAISAYCAWWGTWPPWLIILVKDWVLHYLSFFWHGLSAIFLLLMTMYILEF